MKTYNKQQMEGDVTRPNVLPEVVEMALDKSKYEPLCAETESDYDALRARLYRDFAEVAHDVEMFVNGVIDEAFARGFVSGWKARENPTKFLFGDMLDESPETPRSGA